MTIGLRPEWWDEVEPYLIYGFENLRIRKDAPEELKKKFNSYMKGFLDPNEVILFKKKDFRIRIYFEKSILYIEIDEYYTLKGFHGDEDYYQQYVVIEKPELFRNLTYQSEYHSSILLCIKELFHSYTADIDIMEYCQNNNIPFLYFNRISGGIKSDDKVEMDKCIKDLYEHRKVIKTQNFIH